MKSNSIDRKELLGQLHSRNMKREQIDEDYDKSLTEPLLIPERGDIPLEPPCDFTQEEQMKHLDLTIIARFDDLEKKQDQIIKMLEKLCSVIPKFAGYLTMEEATQRYATDMRTIRQHIKLYQRVRNRHVEIKRFKNDELYREEDLVQALLLDWNVEMNLLQKRDLHEDSYQSN